MSQATRTRSNLLGLLSQRGIDIVLPLAILPYVLHNLGPANFGRVQVALAFGLYFGSLVRFGFSISGSREVASNASQSAKMAQVALDHLVASAVLAICATIGFGLVVSSLPRVAQNIDLYLPAFLTCILQALTPYWLLQGLEKMDRGARVIAVQKCLYFTLVIFWVRTPSDAALLLWLSALTEGIALVAVLQVAHTELPLAKATATWQGAKGTIKCAWHSCVIESAPMLFNNTAIVLLGQRTRANEAGFFTAARRLMLALLSLESAIRAASIPFLIRNPKKIHLYVAALTSLTLFGGGFLILIAPKMTALLFKEDGERIGYYVRALTPWVCAAVLRNMIGISILSLRGHEQAYQRIVLTTSIAGLAACMLLIPDFGPIAAAWILIATTSTMAIAASSYTIINRRTILPMQSHA